MGYKKHRVTTDASRVREVVQGRAYRTLRHCFSVKSSLFAWALPCLMFLRRIHSLSNVQPRSVQGTVPVPGEAVPASSHSPSSPLSPCISQIGSLALLFVFPSQEVGVCSGTCFRNMSNLSVLAGCHLSQGEIKTDRIPFQPFVVPWL